MKHIKTALGVFLVGVTCLWLLADTFAPQPFGYFPFRTVFMQYSGVLGMGAMSLCMLLALRPVWLERHLGGLDKMYRLHKWLGITALATSVLHWWWAQGTRWMVGWGWLVRPPRGPRGAPEPIVTLEQWLRSQRHLAESLGEWTFYAALVLMVLALLKRFPYHWFAKTHKLLALGYLVLVFHSVVLLKVDYWAQPVGWLMALLMATGSVAAVLVLCKRVGAGRKAHGQITALRRYPGLRVLATTIALPQGWRGHRAGQFAFVTSNPREGAHPYTIASAWDDATREVRFVTKALGDHTAALPDKLTVGMPVTVEGPYGCFTFDSDRPRQIWIGGGIGITPFIARMQQLAREAGGAPPQVDLFHSTAEFDQAAMDQLSADAAAARVRLHLLVDARDGYLSGERIRATVPDWQNASIWFCGPAGFGTALRKDFAAQGFDTQRHFHQEVFAMR